MYPKMHSDLHRALRKDLNGQQKLSWENRVKIALHTGRALKYLHTEVTNEKNVRFVPQTVIRCVLLVGNVLLKICSTEMSQSSWGLNSVYPSFLPSFLWLIAHKLVIPLTSAGL